MMDPAMTSTLARSFRALFPAIVSGFGLVVIGGAGIYGLMTGNLLTAVVLAVAGAALVLALFGLVALQIENGERLERIARALEGRAAPRPAEQPAEPEPAAPVLAATRIAVAPRRAPAANGRIEPVVTVSRLGA